ncbi:uncharacterized protein LOC122126058 [Dipodomys spectabilis]|uniref:uncharacterized protein LOC122126058 n=1 Tax=Dipodomys spectabilis TaxID=105255 RepID=UPI001C544F0B|nr:uncharacterized protein LOC122126058 [Dipodomys spectabilis]
MKLLVHQPGLRDRTSNTDMAGESRPGPARPSQKRQQDTDIFWPFPLRNNEQGRGLVLSACERSRAPSALGPSERAAETPVWAAAPLGEVPHDPEEGSDPPACGCAAPSPPSAAGISRRQAFPGRPPELQKPAVGAAGPPAGRSEDPAARAGRAGTPESESNYAPNYELHREGIPYRVYGYQRIPPLIKQVPTKIRRTPVSLGVKSSRSPYKASRNNHLPLRQIKLHTAELHFIREALSQIRAQVDGLLESLQHTGQQRDQSTDEEASISLGGQPIGDGNPSRTISSTGFLFGCPSAVPK